jgi:hypothetical protein
MTKILAWVLFASLTVGCGGWTVSKARTAIDLSAEGVQLTDQVGATLYRERLDDLEAQIESGDLTREQYDQAVLPFHRATEAVVGARESLRVAQAAVDAWQLRGDESTWLEVSPCLFAAIAHLKDLWEEVGLPSPGPLLDAIDIFTRRSRGQCRVRVSEETSP